MHLCFGDLNNESLIKPSSLEKAVRFANALIGRRPGSHQLAYVHFPLAEAVDPPSLELGRIHEAAALQAIQAAGKLT